MFKSELDLVLTIEKHDALVRQCVNGELGFWEFRERYNDFYAYYALDGHESDAEERLLLEKYSNRIEPHRVVAHEILCLVCSDEDAKLDSYKQADRFGSDEALFRLKRVKSAIETKSKGEDPG